MRLKNRLACAFHLAITPVSACDLFLTAAEEATAAAGDPKFLFSSWFAAKGDVGSARRSFGVLFERARPQEPMGAARSCETCGIANVVLSTFKFRHRTHTKQQVAVSLVQNKCRTIRSHLRPSAVMGVARNLNGVLASLPALSDFATCSLRCL